LAKQNRKYSGIETMPVAQLQANDNSSKFHSRPRKYNLPGRTEQKIKKTLGRAVFVKGLQLKDRNTRKSVVYQETQPTTLNRIAIRQHVPAATPPIQATIDRGSPDEPPKSAE
jgi:hypothetical protein